MTINTNAPAYPGQPFQVRNQERPKEGPKTVPVQLDFSKGTLQTIDLNQLLTQEKMTIVQTLFIDNSNNSAGISIQVSATNQIIKLAPNEQGYVPVLAPVPCTLTVFSNSSDIVTIFICNMPLPAAVWNSVAGTFNFTTEGYLETSDVALDAFVGPNGLAVEQLIPISAPTDRGGTITAGGTAQVLAAANANRQGLIIENDIGATESLYVAVVGAATIGGAGNFASLSAGQSCSLNIGGFIITTAVSVIATTTGHRWQATEF